ncbi:putative disease resistance protein RGA1 [Lactuca sativa]|uniref:putative disease resistance protein RGA1 n=1 Tax=Lactuca sativa TaxID=4236 RepID=UPI000CAE0E5B|nr:putative disease resistance protein RGA1 [Lactuca sativa]
MAEALVIIVAGGILKKVLSIAAGELVISWGYDEKLTTLHRTLDLICAKLSDAERKKGTEVVMMWLKQLKVVVGEADDVLDEVHFEMLRREIKKRDRVAKTVPSLPSLKKLSFRWEIGHKIKNINKRLLDINTQANGLGLQNEHPGATPFTDRLYRESVPYPEKFKTVGRDDDVLRIIQILTQSRTEEKLTIVPIVGMGGIGKTTLAKSVYNSKNIKQYFDIKAWLCVSVKVDINTLLAKIYESLAGKKPESDSMVNLIKSLEEKLGSKRYLLVLDDVWVEERAYWEAFESCMLNVNSQNGSGILVTTRKLEIGTTGMKADACLLKGLSDDHCWDIFRERAFVTGSSPSPELEEIGREIVKRCGGLPLLLNVTGGMLANYNDDKEKWFSIKNSKVWDLEEERDRVQKSLELSFDNLPNSIVKQCFVYCSIFKKDKVIKREELVRLWMALGLIQADEERNKEMEAVGNEIFQVLVSNSLFQDVERDEYGRVDHCSMHDMVHDLSLSLSKHESLCLVDATNDDIACIPQFKHLSFYQEQNEYDELKANVSMFIERNTVARTLHTLFIKVEVEKKLSFQRLKCIRILKLKGDSIEKLDDSIGGLVHLRYLNLSSTEIRVLPKSIGKLYHLQTLKLPDRIEQFPETMRNLISLRYLKCDENIPASILGQLTSLRTLTPSFRVLKRKGHSIQELRHLNNLSGSLFISHLENIGSKEEASKADLSSKKNLHNIHFKWSEDDQGANRIDMDVLEGLQPPRDVKTLTIKNFSGDNFPDWVMKMVIYIEGKWTPLDKLMDITLSNCRSCLSLPTLEHLPHLRHLSLENMDSLTCLRTSVGSGIIKPLSPTLTSLLLYRMRKLEKWIDGAPNSSEMISPVLRSLYIRECPKIIHLDECHPHPLFSLQIRGCEGLASIKSIQGLTSLVSLHISMCPSLLEITNLPKQCHSLKTLYITHCLKLTSLPHKLFDCYAFLNELELGLFSKELDSFPSLQGIEKLRNHLHSLYLGGWDHWESIPDEIQHLTSLTLLRINRFGLQELPMWLTNMSSIRDMIFYNCKGLDEEKVKRGAPREANGVTCQIR